MYLGGDMNNLLIVTIVVVVVLGLIYFVKKKKTAYEHVGAVTYFERITDLSPNDAGVHNNKGVELLENDMSSGPINHSSTNFKEAIDAFDKAIKINPGNAVFYYNKGLAFFIVQEYEKAIVSFDKAIEIDPKDPSAYNMKGISLFDSYKPEDAIELYEEAIKVDPKFKESYINKANTLDFLGRHEEALALYDKVLEMDSECSSAYSNKGIALRQLGRHEEAKVAFDMMKILLNKSSKSQDKSSVAIKSQGEFEAFITNFYKMEFIDLVSDSIPFVEKRKPEDYPTSKVTLPPFYGEIFKRNEDKIDEWIGKIDSLSDKNSKEVFWIALWHSNTSKGKKYLEEKLPQSTGGEKELIGHLLFEKPPDLQTLNPRLPKDNDMLWMVFLVTGDPIYVENIIKAAIRYNYRTDPREFVAAGTAKWSLASNAQKHEIVMDTLKKAHKKYMGEEKAIIEDIIEKAEIPNGFELIWNEMEEIVEQKIAKGEWDRSVFQDR